jgi:hypothetical protein
MTVSKSTLTLTLISSILVLGMALSRTASARGGDVRGSYTATGIVPAGDCSHAHPNVTGSQDWYIRDVIVNGVLLTENIDYTVVDDGSNKGLVSFITHPIRGDRVEINGPTLESGAHIGRISFF